ncbi:hypothetical protein VTL71DRAFT_14157 [Oculimacula yallundae]|uniref:Alpha/beta-hydrolase n=1 Tax=Oculimacula yallundae TaxID=86028 RepID=A0ABR4CHT4_9HELO
MQQLIAAPGLVSCWRLGVKSRAKPRRVASITRCIRNSTGISTSRPRSSRESSRYEFEKFIVKCGSSGSITVDLYNSSVLSDPTNTLIIHLPPTGAHLRHDHSPIPSYLIRPKTALASINYRWNITSTSPSTTSPKQLYNTANHAWPIPLHDTLAGYTFLLSHLSQYTQPSPSPSTSSSSSSPSTSQSKSKSNTRNSIYASSPSPNFVLPTQRPILLYGSFLGGTLATSLALTENTYSRLNPSKIIGLICKDGVYDWTEIVSSPPTSQESPSTAAQTTDSGSGSATSSSWSNQTLHTLKKTLFSSPSSAFDPFASPTLFFRTSGLSIPRSWPTASDPDGIGLNHLEASSLSPSETEDIWPSEGDDLHLSLEDLNREYGRTSASVISSPSPGSEAASNGPSNPNPSPSPAAQKTLAQRISELSITPPSRPAHLKYPPTGSNLKIPFSLFLYTRSPSDTPTSSPSSSTSIPRDKSQASSMTKTKTRPLSKYKTKSKSKEQHQQQEQNPTNTPLIQADKISFLLQRSVSLHEFGERKQWDSELDPEAESQWRVGMRALTLGDGVEDGRGGKVEGRKSGEEGGDEGEREREIVRRWIEEVTG